MSKKTITVKEEPADVDYSPFFLLNELGQGAIIKHESQEIIKTEVSYCFIKLFSKLRIINHLKIIYYISALASAPSRPPNPTVTPQNQASSKNPRSKVPKLSEHYTK